MDILIIINDFRTLMDIMFVNPIHINMVQRALMMIAHATMMVA
jgi:hypothetical protein